MFKQLPRQVVSGAKEALNNLSANIGSCVMRVNEEVNEEVIEADEAAAAEGDGLFLTPIQEEMPSDTNSEPPMAARDKEVNEADGSFPDGEVVGADEAAAAESDSPYPPPTPPKKQKTPSDTEPDPPRPPAPRRSTTLKAASGMAIRGTRSRWRC